MRAEKSLIVLDSAASDGGGEPPVDPPPDPEPEPDPEPPADGGSAVVGMRAGDRVICYAKWPTRLLRARGSSIMVRFAIISADPGDEVTSDSG